ncbi:cobalamin synthase [Deltaproteobacteria bacterium Smac51]|nr:cobalamin synthase [Deltaproteobacteria bacterium Smac51]
MHTELENLQMIDMDAGQVFSGLPSGTFIKGYAAPSIYTPKPDVDYLFHESSRDVIVWFLEKSDPLYIFGPTGAGKTSVVKQLASRLNYPVFEVTGHSRLEFPDLAGHLTVKDSQMQFQYGPLALAMKFGGIMLLNEIDLLDPSTAAGLNSVLDGSPLCIPENGGEIITPHAMFRFVATANTNGASDETGLYQGTLRQNLAFLDRFILCEVGYPKPELELELLSKVSPELPSDLRAKMVEYANEVRRLFLGQSENPSGQVLDITFSTRTLIRWANLTVRFQPLAKQGLSPINHALDRALAFRANAESRTFLYELAQRIFPNTIKEES